MKSVYLDYAATTPVDPRVAEKMQGYLTLDGYFGNPGSAHHFGQMAKQGVDHARQCVADLLQAESSEIIWTSGATEANNLALKGAANLYQGKGKHIITLKTEHPSVLETCQFLEKKGFFVSYLNPKANGLVDFDLLRSTIREDTILVSIMHVNNETGVIQDIETISQLTAEKGILLHVDAAQSAGKLPINVKQMPIDLISLSAHKIYGPKGIGALYVRRKPRVRVAPQIHGGGQEQGMRSGTIPAHQIVGMGEAFAIAKQEMSVEYQRIFHLRERFCKSILAMKINGDLEHCYPGIINSCFNKKAEWLIKTLPELAFSMGSACMSKGVGPSYVLKALGLTDEQALCSIRISIGRFTTESDIDFAVSQINKNI